ncbi:MAG: hypothetical protein WA921_11530 [Ahrensia sp.]
MRIAISTLVLCTAPIAAHAACPQELAIYTSQSGTSGLEFVAGSDAVAMSHEVRLLVADDLVMTGYVGVTQVRDQSFLLVPHECPDGDVTGEELAQCMVYEDVFYAIGDDGVPGRLPLRGEDAAPGILLPGFLQQLEAQAERLGADAVAAASEVFQLSGCQE